MIHNAEGLVYRRLAPDEVLAFLVELHRVLCESGDADPDVTLTFDTTIRAWRDSMLAEFEDWQRIAGYLNETFGTDWKPRQWKPAIVPARRETLGDVCDLVASKVRVPEVRPVNVLGKSCASAGAFLALREMIAGSGESVDDLRPTTPLARYAESAFPKFHRQLLLLAPRLLSSIRPRGFNHDIWLLPAAGILFFAVLLTCAFAFVAPWPFAPVAVLCTALFFLAWWLSDKLAQRPPESVTFEGLADFRALSYVLAGESPTPRRIRAAARGTRRPS
jgi:hypothetical protein